MNFFDEMEISLKSKVNNSFLRKLLDKESEFWNEIALIHLQTEGLLLGYNSKVSKEKKLLMHDIYFVNADGQISELLSIFRNFNTFESFRYKEKKKVSPFNSIFREYRTKDPDYLWEKLMSRSHCSAFIKILRDENNAIKDVLLAHSTWDDYSAMIRIFKQLSFNFHFT